MSESVAFLDLNALEGYTPVWQDLHVGMGDQVSQLGSILKAIKKEFCDVSERKEWAKSKCLSKKS